MAEARTQRPRRPRRTALLVTAGILLALLAAGAWLGVRTLSVKAEFEAIQPIAQQLRSAIADKDLDRAETLAAQLMPHLQRARDGSSDIVWRAAESVPKAGENLRALRVASSHLEIIARGIPDLLDAARDLTEGHAGALVDVSAIEAMADPVARTRDAVMLAGEDLRTIREDDLIGPVRTGVTQLKTVVADLEPSLEMAARAAAIAPALLGADAPRDILVMVQNSAELRTGGGITGTFIELAADAGRIELKQQADSSDFPVAATTVAELPESTVALYSDVVGRYVQNASMPTDFAVSAKLVSAWWRGLTGRTPDAVVSVDPFVLQAVLSALGPVATAEGSTLDADNVLQALLVDPYLTLDPDQQTQLFAGAAEAVFARLSAGDADPIALLEALATPAAEGHIAVWSADEAIEDTLRSTIIGGVSSRLDAAGRDSFGVFFNDATGAKMAHYLDVGIEAGVVGCRDDGIEEVRVAVTVGSHAPTDVASLPFSVTGGGLNGVAVGDIGTNISVSAPADAYFGSVIVKGEPYPAPTVVDDGRPSTAARVNLSPGEVNTLEFTFLLRGPDRDDIRIVHTPLINKPDVTVSPVACG